MKVIDYFNPFSKSFNACAKFNTLSVAEKTLTVFVTVIASLVSLPIGGLGGVAAFRLMVERYTFKKIDSNAPQDPSETKDIKTARKVDAIAQNQLPPSFPLPVVPFRPKTPPSVDNKLSIVQNPVGPSQLLLQTMNDVQGICQNFAREGYSPQLDVRYDPKSLTASIRILALPQGEIPQGFRLNNEVELIVNLKELAFSSPRFFANFPRSIPQVFTFNASSLAPLSGLLANPVHVPAIGWEIVQGIQKQLCGIVYDSNHPEEIRWKTEKYERIILQLRAHIKAVQQIHPALPDSMEGSWVLMTTENTPAILEQMLKKLEGLRIDETNPDRFSLEYLDQVRKLYNQQFLGTLRSGLVQDPANRALQDISAILFTQIRLEEQSLKTVELFERLGASQVPSEIQVVDLDGPEEHPFVQRMHTLYQGLHSAAPPSPLLSRLGNSAKGQWNRNFDPTVQGNPIHILYELKAGGKTIKALGFGTPTSEDWKSNVAMTPEFMAFGKAYQRQGKRHLFVLNQNTIPKTDLNSMFLNGDETGRSEAILGAQDDPELQGAVFCIALSKNSRFYEQKGDFEQSTGAEDFKERLYQHVFFADRKVSGCYIPECIRKEYPGLLQEAEKGIEAIHAHLFESRTDLTVDERKLFIEYFYDLLIVTLLLNLKIDSFNISCKDAIDRGAGSNAQLLSNLTILNHYNPKSPQVDLPEEQQKKIAAVMMARAFMVRKRPPLKERVERFMEGLEFSLKHPGKLHKLYTAVFGAVPLS